MTDKPKQWLYQDLIGNMSRFTFPVCRFVQLGYGRTEYFTWEDTITDPSVIALSFYSGWLSFTLVASTDAGAIVVSAAILSHLLLFHTSHTTLYVAVIWLISRSLRTHWQMAVSTLFTTSLFSQGSSPTQGGTTSTSSSRRWRWNMRRRRRTLLTTIVP